MASLKAKLAEKIANGLEQDDDVLVERTPKYKAFKLNGGLDSVIRWQSEKMPKRKMMVKIGEFLYKLPDNSLHPENKPLHKNTFYNWVNNFPEFKLAIEEGKTASKESLEEAMHKLALGGYDLRKQTVDKFGDVHDLLEEQAPHFQALKLSLQKEDRDWVIETKQEINIGAQDKEILEILNGVDTDILLALIEGKDVEIDGDI